jgi:hypothetical protein
MTAIDEQVKAEDDKETIGLIICKTKNATVVEYALNKSNQPMGIAEYSFTQLPEEFSQYLPNTDELENAMQ